VATTALVGIVGGDTAACAGVTLRAGVSTVLKADRAYWRPPPIAGRK
jgi:hypothetical protein